MYDPDAQHGEIDLTLTAVSLDFRCPLTSVSRHHMLPMALRPRLDPRPDPIRAVGSPD